MATTIGRERTGERAEDVDGTGAPRPPRRDFSFASPSLTAHLLRGLLGFGPLALAWYLWPRIGWLAAIPAAAGVVALRGCPMCWTVGLVQTLARGRYVRACADGACSLVRRGSSTSGAGTVRS